ncbi:unnamed protein product, partial [Rotaria sp. Silwood2]
MERFLPNLPYLTDLELCVHSRNDFIDGHRWQLLTSGLKTFNFNFQIVSDQQEVNLESFRSAFWLEEKYWYVAYDNNCLFSVPYFIPINETIRNLVPLYRTTPDDQIFYE